MTGHWTALVPLRDLSGGKTRLGSVLGPAERRAVTEYAAQAVVQSCLGAPSVARTVVVTGSSAVAAWATKQGAEFWEEPAGCSGLAPAMQSAAAAFASARGGVVMLMGDLPLLRVAGLEQWLARAMEMEAAFAPSAARTGTNLLALAPGCAMELSFGAPDSLARHRRSARAAGLRYRTIACSGAALDIDEPGDIARLARSPSVRAALPFLGG